MPQMLLGRKQAGDSVGRDRGDHSQEFLASLREAYPALAAQVQVCAAGGLDLIPWIDPSRPLPCRPILADLAEYGTELERETSEAERIIQACDLFAAIDLKAAVVQRYLKGRRRHGTAKSTIPGQLLPATWFSAWLKAAGRIDSDSLADLSPSDCEHDPEPGNGGGLDEQRNALLKDLPQFRAHLAAGGNERRASGIFFWVRKIVRDCGFRDADDVRPSVIRLWATREYQHGRTDSTLMTYYTRFKKYLNWLVETGRMSANPLGHLGFKACLDAAERDAQRAAAEDQRFLQSEVAGFLKELKRSRHFDCERAYRLLGRMIRACGFGKPGDVVAGPILLWLEGMKVKPRTRQGYRVLASRFCRYLVEHERIKPDAVAQMNAQNTLAFAGRRRLPWNSDFPLYEDQFEAVDKQGTPRPSYHNLQMIAGNSAANDHADAKEQKRKTQRLFARLSSVRAIILAERYDEQNAPPPGGSYDLRCDLMNLWLNAEGTPTYHNPRKCKDRWNQLPEKIRFAIASDHCRYSSKIPAGWRGTRNVRRQAEASRRRQEEATAAKRIAKGTVVDLAQHYRKKGMGPEEAWEHQDSLSPEQRKAEFPGYWKRVATRSAMKQAMQKAEQQHGPVGQDKLGRFPKHPTPWTESRDSLFLEWKIQRLIDEGFSRQQATEYENLFGRKKGYSSVRRTSLFKKAPGLTNEEGAHKWNSMSPKDKQRMSPDAAGAVSPATFGRGAFRAWCKRFPMKADPILQKRPAYNKRRHLLERTEALGSATAAMDEYDRLSPKQRAGICRRYPRRICLGPKMRKSAKSVMRHFIEQAEWEREIEHMAQEARSPELQREAQGTEAKEVDGNGAQRPGSAGDAAEARPQAISEPEAAADSPARAGEVRRPAKQKAAKTGLLSPAELCEHFQIPHSASDAVKKRLDRFRRKNLGSDGYTVIDKRRRNEPAYRYDPAIVRPILESLIPG